MITVKTNFNKFTEESYNAFKSFAKSDKRIILQNILKYSAFFDSCAFEQLNLKTKVKNRYGICKIIKNDIEYSIFLKEKSRLKILIVYKQEETTIGCLEFLDRISHINESVFSQFIFAIAKNEKRQRIILKAESSLNYEYKSFIKNETYKQFLVGTGVSLDYGASSWSKLIKNMTKKINLIIPGMSLNDIKKDVFGNNYGIPQVLKDLNYKTYYRSIFESLYSKRYTHKDKTLFAIAKVLKSQYDNGLNEQAIVTFNYDDFLEKELEYLEFCDYTSFYSGIDKKSAVKKSLSIKHIHGFMPQNCFKSPKENKYCKSIVLTDDDYNISYGEKNFVYRTLRNFIKKSTVIVGNSMSDYEERKVFRSSFKNTSQFHFALRKKSGNIDNDNYISSFFLNIGVITVFFDTYNDIKEFIESLCIKEYQPA